MTRSIIIDADSHIMEPPTLWQEYMDPEFRSRACESVWMNSAWSISTSMARSASGTTGAPWAGLRASTRPGSG